MTPEETARLRNQLVSIRMGTSSGELEHYGPTWKELEEAIYNMVVPTEETHDRRLLPEQYVLEGLKWFCHVMVHDWVRACASIRMVERAAQASSREDRVETLYNWAFHNLEEIVFELSIAVGVDGVENEDAGLWTVQDDVPDSYMREDLHKEGRYMPVPSPLEPPDLVPCPITREIMAEIVPDDPESSERLRERIERIHRTCQAYIYEFERLFDLSGQTWAARYAGFLRTLGLAVELMGLSLETIFLLELVHSSLPLEYHKKQLELATARLKAEERLRKRKRRSEGSKEKSDARTVWDEPRIRNGARATIAVGALTCITGLLFWLDPGGPRVSFVLMILWIISSAALLSCSIWFLRRLLTHPEGKRREMLLLALLPIVNILLALCPLSLLRIWLIARDIRKMLM